MSIWYIIITVVVLLTMPNLPKNKDHEAKQESNEETKQSEDNDPK